jgi:hypothetical protein
VRKTGVDGRLFISTRRLISLRFLLLRNVGIRPSDGKKIEFLRSVNWQEGVYKSLLMAIVLKRLVGIKGEGLVSRESF